MNRRFDKDFENPDWSNERYRDRDRDLDRDRDRDDERWAERWRGERPMRGAGYGGWSTTPSGYNTGMTGYSSYNYGQRTDWDRGDYDREYDRGYNYDRDRDYRRTMGWGEGEPRHLQRESLTERLGERVRRFFGKGPKGYKRSDQRILEDVCDRLSEGWIDASDIDVTVTDAEVTLTGFVDDRRMKYIAEDLAERVIGVKDVHNQLRVRRPEEVQTLGTMSSGTMATQQQQPQLTGSQQQPGKRNGPTP